MNFGWNKLWLKWSWLKWDPTIANSKKLKSPSRSANFTEVRFRGLRRFTVRKANNVNKTRIMTDSQTGNLVDEALKRKERLAALKRKSEEIKENNNENGAKLPKWVILYLRLERLASSYRAIPSRKTCKVNVPVSSRFTY